MKRTAYGIKSERTDGGIVWHVVTGWKDDASQFATWTQILGTYSDHGEACEHLGSLEARANLRLLLDNQ